MRYKSVYELRVCSASPLFIFIFGALRFPFGFQPKGKPKARKAAIKINADPPGKEAPRARLEKILFR